jgi:hypothetical protein
MDILSDILTNLNVSGTLDFRTEFGGRWAISLSDPARVTLSCDIYRIRLSPLYSTGQRCLCWMRRCPGCRNYYHKTRSNHRGNPGSTGGIATLSGGK